MISSLLLLSYINQCQSICLESSSLLKCTSNSFLTHSSFFLPLYHYYAVDLSTKRVLEAAGNMDRARAVDAGTVYYSTVQCSVVQCSTVQYSTAQCSTVQYSTVQHSTVQCSTVQYSVVQYSTVQYSTVQYTVILDNSMVWWRVLYAMAQ